MSSSPPKTPSPHSSSSQSFQDSDSDDDQEVSSNSQTRKSFQDVPQVSDPKNIVKNQCANNTLENSPNQSIVENNIQFQAKKRSRKELATEWWHRQLKQESDGDFADKCAESLGSALDELSRDALSVQEQPSTMPRPQKPSALTIKKLMSESPPRLLVPPGSPIKTRMPAPHLRKFQNQGEQTATGSSRNVESSQKKRIGSVFKERAWWKMNWRKEKADMILMPPPPPPQQSSVDKRVHAPEKSFMNQEKLKRKLDSQEENENEIRHKKRRLKLQEYDQTRSEKLKLKGLASNEERQENGFLFSLSVSESEDDYVTLKFLSAYILNGVDGENLASKSASAVVNFINGNEEVSDNCQITVPGYRKKVLELHKKFLNLVKQNGGENFSEAYFSTGREYEIAKLCKIVWGDRQESGGFGSFVDLKSDVGRGSDEIKLVGEIVRGVKGISLRGAGEIVDAGHGSSDLGVNVDHGNRAGLEMNVDQGDGADPAGVKMDHGADTGASADQQEDSMDIDRTSVDLCNTVTIQESKARNGTEPPMVYRRRTEHKKLSKKEAQGSTAGV